MSSLRAIIVDDEAGCVQNLAYHLTKYCPELEVVATAGDTATAASLLCDKSIDVAFLDVELFNENIFSILHKTGERVFEIVFVTAHERYAVEAFRVSAIDYIVKPLNKKDIIRCYEKIKGKYNPGPFESFRQAVQPEAAKKIILRDGKEVYVIAPADIVFLEASGFYTIIHFFTGGAARSVLLSKSIKELHKEYCYPYLMRVHRSFAINTGLVAAIKKTATGLSLQMANNITIPVARRRINSFLEHYRQNQ